MEDYTCIGDTPEMAFLRNKTYNTKNIPYAEQLDSNFKEKIGFKTFVKACNSCKYMDEVVCIKHTIKMQGGFKQPFPTYDSWNYICDDWKHYCDNWIEE